MIFEFKIVWLKNYNDIILIIDGRRLFKNNGRWGCYNVHRQVNEKITKAYNRRLK